MCLLFNCTVGHLNIPTVGHLLIPEGQPGVGYGGGGVWALLELTEHKHANENSQMRNYIASALFPLVYCPLGVFISRSTIWKPWNRQDCDGENILTVTVIGNIFFPLSCMIF